MPIFKCKIHGLVRAHSSGKFPRCSVCNNERMKAKHQQLRIRAIEYGGNKCQKCGYNKCRAALEFHHTDPTKKEIEISRVYKRSWEMLKLELDKCILLCANCHREIHNS